MKAFRICTKGKTPSTPEGGICELIELEGQRPEREAFRYFRVACKYGAVAPGQKRYRRSSQRRRYLRGGDVELSVRMARGWKTLATCRRAP